MIADEIFEFIFGVTPLADKTSDRRVTGKVKSVKEEIGGDVALNIESGGLNFFWLASPLADKLKEAFGGKLQGLMGLDVTLFNPVDNKFTRVVIGDRRKPDQSVTKSSNSAKPNPKNVKVKVNISENPKLSLSEAMEGLEKEIKLHNQIVALIDESMKRVEGSAGKDIDAFDRHLSGTAYKFDKGIFWDEDSAEASIGNSKGGPKVIDILTRLHEYGSFAEAARSFNKSGAHCDRVAYTKDVANALEYAIKVLTGPEFRGLHKDNK